LIAEHVGKVLERIVASRLAEMVRVGCLQMHRWEQDENDGSNSTTVAHRPNPDNLESKEAGGVNVMSR
jgi:hypothetical protein